jgi:hypothetical protein
MWLQHDHPCLRRRRSLHIAPFGGPSVRAACGGDPSLTRLPLSVMVLKHDGAEARWRWPRLIVIGIQARRPSQMTSVSPPVTLQARNATTFTHRPRTVKSR